MKLFRISVFLFLTLGLVAQAGAENGYSKEALNRIYAATYEVVVKKLGDGEVTYDQPLPLDNLPFHIRNDKYWSIGTAFAIDENTFITAAHVFGLTHESQFNEFYLRDTKGKVHEIGKVRKFSGPRDFIVFEMKKLRAKSTLEVNENPEVNDTVYSVGNALGDGVVIRDGRYTSNTPEEDAGRWEWMRFSAAASPGNSGGPLLDEKARVVGIVLGKSQNENLNFALPIREVIKAKKNLAVHDFKMMYSLENLEMQEEGRMDFKEKLPLSLSELRHKLVSQFERDGMSLLEKMMKKNSNKIFPNGDGANEILHKYYAGDFPRIIWQKGDGRWTPYRPDNINGSDLGKEGEVWAGVLGDTVLMKFGKPDNVSLKSFNTDGKIFMDMMLKVMRINRSIGNQKVRLTSIGKPSVTEVHVDRYKRKWQVRKWYIPYDDSAIATLSLPTPSGNVTLLRSSSTGNVDGNLADLKAMTDFYYGSYYGTLEEWGDYFKLGKMLPDAMNDIKLSFKEGKYVKFESRDLSFNYDSSLMNITAKSDLFMNMSYFMRDDKVAWDVVRVAVGEDSNSGKYFDVAMNFRPNDKMADEDHSAWKKLVNREFPYNKVSYFKDKQTRIHALFLDKVKAKKAEKMSALYTVSYTMDGKEEQDAAEVKLETFMKGVKVPALK